MNKLVLATHECSIEKKNTAQQRFVTSHCLYCSQRTVAHRPETCAYVCLLALNHTAAPVVGGIIARHGFQKLQFICTIQFDISFVQRRPTVAQLPHRSLAHIQKKKKKLNLTAAFCFGAVANRSQCTNRIFILVPPQLCKSRDTSRPVCRTYISCDGTLASKQIKNKTKTLLLWKINIYKGRCALQRMSFPDYLRLVFAFCHAPGRTPSRSTTALAKLRCYSSNIKGRVDVEPSRKALSQ